MATLPDAAGIDFNQIALWAAGITTVGGSIVTAAWLAISNAMKIAKSLPAPVTKTETNIVTADSVAMHELVASLEASNFILSENNTLRREEHADRAANRLALEANTAAIERVLSAINEARQEIRDLTREIVRSNK